MEAELKKNVRQLTKAISLADAMAAWFGGPTDLARTPAIMLRVGLGTMRANDRMAQFIAAINQGAIALCHQSLCLELGKRLIDVGFKE